MDTQAKRLIYNCCHGAYGARMTLNELTHEIIGAAIEVHRELGPGKKEAAYEHALVYELDLRGLPYLAQRPLPVVYKGLKLDCGYRLDVLVQNLVVVEAKSLEEPHPIHRAQVLTYLKLGGWKVGLLLNFNVPVLKDGIERLVLRLEENGGAGINTTPPNGLDRFRTEARTLSIQASSTDAIAEALASEVVAAAEEVHQILGPGLLPSAYEACLCRELRLRGISFERKVPLTLSYKQKELITRDEIPLLVGGRVVVNPVSILSIESVHEATLLSQLRLGGWEIGLLFNFNTILLKDGMRRMVLSRTNSEEGRGQKTGL